MYVNRTNLIDPLSLENTKEKNQNLSHKDNVLRKDSLPQQLMPKQRNNDSCRKTGTKKVFPLESHQEVLKRLPKDR